MRPDRISSVLARVEVDRAVRRVPAPALLTARADAVLARLTLLGLVPPIVEAAGRLGPPELRSLDAIHLASALSIRDDLEVFITYDRRLAAAAERAQLPIAAPAP